MNVGGAIGEKIKAAVDDFERTVPTAEKYVCK